MEYPLNVGLGRDLAARIAAAAKRYHVSKATVARYAMQAGLRAALQRLQRERPDLEPEAAPDAEATG